MHNKLFVLAYFCFAYITNINGDMPKNCDKIWGMSNKINGIPVYSTSIYSCSESFFDNKYITEKPSPIKETPTENAIELKNNTLQNNTLQNNTLQNNTLQNYFNNSNLNFSSLNPSPSSINYPSPSSVNYPSSSSVNYPSSSSVNYPSSSSVNYPSSSSVNYPSPSSVNYPSPSSVNYPSPSSVNYPSPSSVNYPSPSSVNYPSSSSVNYPSPSSINYPSSSSVNYPSSSSINYPSPSPSSLNDLLSGTIIEISQPSTFINIEPSSYDDSVLKNENIQTDQTKNILVIVLVILSSILIILFIAIGSVYLKNKRKKTHPKKKEKDLEKGEEILDAKKSAEHLKKFRTKWNGGKGRKANHIKQTVRKQIEKNKTTKLGNLVEKITKPVTPKNEEQENPAPIKKQITMPEIPLVRGIKKPLPIRKRLTMPEIPPGMGFDDKNLPKPKKNSLKTNKKIESPIPDKSNTDKSENNN